MTQNSFHALNKCINRRSWFIINTNYSRIPERDRCGLNTYIYNEMSKSNEGIINNCVKRIPYLIMLYVRFMRKFVETSFL